jgi:hypothetical protein
MIYEIKGLCPECLEEVCVLVHNEGIISDCPKCRNDPFEFNRIEGVVYVVKNPNQSGVKIGLTRKSVEQRCKSLSSSGVAGKLAKHKLDKEHFNLGVVEASLKVFRALNKRIDPIFYDDDVRDRFRLELEKARIDMQLRLKGKMSAA